MPPFPQPRFQFEYDVAHEIEALRTYRDTEPGRQIPQKADGRLLIATWNVANLGLQERVATDYQLIGEIMSWFDVITVQEVNDDLTGIRAIQASMPARYKLLFSDASGNRERQAFLFDEQRVTQLEEVGRLAIPPSDFDSITLPDTTTAFPGFDRGPYLGTFAAGAFEFMLVSVHLYFGSTAPADLDRRKLETFAVAWWADKHHRDPHTYVPSILPLGDFNLPKAAPGDPIFDALTRRGLVIPPHSSQIASAIATDNQYDQIGFFTGDTKTRFTGQMSVFDFDGALFSDLHATRSRSDFLAYTRFHMSDHRPLWAEFRTD